MKTIIGWLLPSNKKLALAAAKKIQGGVNTTLEDKKEAVTKYATVAGELSATASTLSHFLTDGTIDDVETDTLAAILEPLFAKAREVLGV